MGCGANRIGGNGGSPDSGRGIVPGRMFFVWQGSLPSGAWVGRLSLLAGASIIAAFPSRGEAAAYALQRSAADSRPCLVAERGFSHDAGDCNNLISEMEWPGGARSVSGAEDAPHDGNIYGRQNGQWVAVGEGCQNG